MVPTLRQTSIRQPWHRIFRRSSQSPAVIASAALITWLLVCMAWTIFRWGGDIASKVFGLYYDLPVGPTLGYLCWQVAGLRRTKGTARIGWKVLAVAYVTYWLGNCTWNVYEGILHIEPFPSIADVFFLAFYPLVIFGLSRLTSRLPTARDNAKFLLDCTCAAVSAIALLWYFGLRYIEIDNEHGLIGRVVSAGYPIVDIMLLIAVVSAFLKRQYSGIGISLGLLAASYVAMMAGDVIFLVPALKGKYSSGGLADGLFQASYALVACAAMLQLIPGVRTSAVVNKEQGYRFQLFPYASAFAVYSLLVWQIRTEWMTPDGILTLVAVGTTALVMGRQILATLEIAELSATKAVLVTEARYKSLVKNSSDIVLVIGEDGLISFATPSIARMVGISPEDALGKGIEGLMHPDHIHDARLFCRDLHEDPALVGPVEWRLKSLDDQTHFVEVVGSNLLDEPSVRGLVLNLRNITERRRLEEDLKQLAFTDSLTLLPNRNLFNEQLALALSRDADGKSVPILIFVDLDNFKKINDTLGHETGDKVLAIAAQRLIRATRSSDIVARLGGDEFAVLISDESSDDYIKSLADRLITMLSNPFELNGRRMSLSASLGIARCEHGLSPQEVMRNADLAMYRAKAQGKHCFEMYEVAMYADLMQTVDLEAEMLNSLDQGDFVPYFQPIVDLATSEIVGIEALIRWHHPERGVLFPNTFIQIAEDSGLIKKLGREVLFQTCRHVAAWLKCIPADRLRHVAINVSGRQLEHPALIDEVRMAITESGLDPGIIVLEITESVLMQNVTLAISQLNRLKDLGVRIALDDFGTGYSSLSHVHRFPIDILKIDRSFIESINKPGGSALVRAIMGLASALELKVVAEGIERPGQIVPLQQLDCQFGQGYHFGRPETPEDTRQLLMEVSARTRLSLVKSDGSVPRAIRPLPDSVSG